MFDISGQDSVLSYKVFCLYGYITNNTKVRPTVQVCDHVFVVELDVYVFFFSEAFFFFP